VALALDPPGVVPTTGPMAAAVREVDRLVVAAGARRDCSPISGFRLR
jgi:hypothetical protein